MNEQRYFTLDTHHCLTPSVCSKLTGLPVLPKMLLMTHTDQYSVATPFIFFSHRLSDKSMTGYCTVLRLVKCVVNQIASQILVFKLGRDS